MLKDIFHSITRAAAAALFFQLEFLAKRNKKKRKQVDVKNDNDMARQNSHSGSEASTAIWKSINGGVAER